MAAAPTAPEVVLVDAMNLLYRTSDSPMAHVIGDDLVPTGGCFGMLRSLLRLRGVHPAARIQVCWEGYCNYRFALYPGYKANRNLDKRARRLTKLVTTQVWWVRELLRTLGVVQWSGMYCEGDDVVATVAANEAAQGQRVEIYSTDSDLRQLVTEHVTLRSATRGGADDLVWTVKDVQAEYGFAPPQLADYKALAGDRADHVPGLPRVGDKQARALVVRYGDVPSIIERAQDQPGWEFTPRLASIVRMNADDLRLWRRITHIDAGAELIRLEPVADASRLEDLLSQIGFISIAGDVRAAGALRNIADPAAPVAPSGEVSAFPLPG